MHEDRQRARAGPANPNITTNWNVHCGLCTSQTSSSLQILHGIEIFFTFTENTTYLQISLSSFVLRIMPFRSPRRNTHPSVTGRGRAPIYSSRRQNIQTCRWCESLISRCKPRRRVTRDVRGPCITGRVSSGSCLIKPGTAKGDLSSDAMQLWLYEATRSCVGSLLT